MQAFVDGETIQIQRSRNGEWRDVSQPSFKSEFEYRVKPAELPPPIEGWVNLRGAHQGYIEIGGCLWNTEKRAREMGVKNKAPIYMREVTEADRNNCLSPYQIGRVAGENHKLKASLRRIRANIEDRPAESQLNYIHNIVEEALK